jgi:hypothetical protein
VANIASLRYAIERLGVPSELTTDTQIIRNANNVILLAGTVADCMGYSNAPVCGYHSQSAATLPGHLHATAVDSSEEGDVIVWVATRACASLQTARDRLCHWANTRNHPPSPLLNHFSENDYKIRAAIARR